MGTRMIRDRSSIGGWWLMLALFPLCVGGWSLAFSFKAGATEAPQSFVRDADRVWEVSGFNRISIAGSSDVQLVQGAGEGVYGNGDSKDLERLEVVVRGRELIIRPRRQNWFEGWLDDDVDLLITYRDLSSLKLSGSGDLAADSMSSNDLSLRVSGSGDVRIDELTVNELELAISGSADVVLAGSAADQSVNISGSADYTAENLQSESARVRISGSADALIQVSNALEAKVSGSGSVRYAGNPTVSQRVSGSGEIRPL